MDKIGKIAEDILEQLEIKDVFSFTVGDVTVNVAESVVVSWIVIGAVLVLSLILTTGLKVKNISRRQALAEWLVTKGEELVGGMVGEEGREYVPYLLTVLIYIGFSNCIGLFGFKPPTKDLNVTAALAIMSIVLVQAAAIRRKSIGGWIKGFTQPVALVTPINILELGIKPLSLCMRLFGNVLGAFVIMELLKVVVPAVLPAAFSLYFDLFDGFLQAYVFVFLTGMYIKEAIE